MENEKEFYCYSKIFMWWLLQDRPPNHQFVCWQYDDRNVEAYLYTRIALFPTQDHTQGAIY